MWLSLGSRGLPGKGTLCDNNSVSYLDLDGEYTFDKIHLAINLKLYRKKMLNKSHWAIGV